jgi:hypothetical protein
MARDYLKVAGAMTPFASVVDRSVDEARGDPAVRQRMAEQARESMRSALTFQKLLGPNPRTIILGISMGFGTPLYFLLAEAVLLNLLLAWSVRHHNAVERRLAETLEHARR